MPYRTEYAQQVVKITEYRDNCIWKTAIVATIWVDQDVLMDDKEKCLEIARSHGGDFLSSMPTNTPYDQYTHTIKVD